LRFCLCDVVLRSLQQSRTALRPSGESFDRSTIFCGGAWVRVRPTAAALEAQ
jgi:hypothetical protein